MKLDLIKEHYFHEQNRRHQLESAMSLPVAILATLVGLTSFYVQILPIPVTSWNLLFYLLLGLGVLSLFAAFVFLVLSFARIRYSEIATTREWIAYYDQLRDYAATMDSEFDIDKDLEDSLKSRYSDAVDHNSAGNIKRMAYLYWAKVLITSAALSLSLCAFPYLAIKSRKTSTIQKVKIVPDFSGNAKDQGDSTMADDPKKRPPQPPPQKPEPPPNRETRDGSPKPK